MRILNRPAAVSSAKVHEQDSHPLFRHEMGRAFKDGVSQKTCQYHVSKAFWDWSLGAMLYLSDYCCNDECCYELASWEGCMCAISRCWKCFLGENGRFVNGR